MPLYTFVLKQGAAPVVDDGGVYLPDREHALAYAKEVARELMEGREEQIRFWRLDVYEDNDLRVFKLPFAALDRTLDHLAPERRSLVETVCNWRRSSRETIHASRITRRESQALVARSRGRPYLAAIAGEQTIR